MRFPIFFAFGWPEMATALQAMRKTLSLWMGDYREVESTSAGEAGGTTAVSTSLADQSNDYYNTWYLKAIDMSGAPVRRISDFVSSGGTVTVAVAFAAQVPNTTTLELHKYDPDLKDEAIKQTLRTVYPYLYVPVVDETLITGDWLRNGNFEDWAAAANPDNWTKSASATLAEETSAALIRYGASSLKITADAATQYAFQDQLRNKDLLDLRGQRARFRAWAYTDTASNARLQIYDVKEDATATTTSSSYHSGNSRWQLLEVERVLPNDLSTIEFRLTSAVNTKIAYYDQARVFGPQKYHFYLSTDFIDLEQVSVQRMGIQLDSNTGETLDPADDLRETYPFFHIARSQAGKMGWRLLDDGTDKILHINMPLVESYRLRLVGRKRLTVPTTDTGTSQIDAPQVDYLLALAARRLRSMLPQLDDQTRERLNAIEAQVEILRRQHAHVVKAL